MRLIDADKLLLHLADYQLQESPGWGANGCGNADAYEAITNCIKAIEEAPVVVEDFDKEGMCILDFEQTAEKLGRSMFGNNSIHDLEELAEKVGSATVYDAAKEERTEEHAEMHACDSIHDIEELAKKVGVVTIEEARNEAKKDDPYKHDTDLISRRAAIDIINRIENMDPKAKGGITVNLALLPDLNPEPDLKEEILEAVEMLKEKYEEAKKISYINKPFEYALYHTWKEFDGRNKVMR